MLHLLLDLLDAGWSLTAQMAPYLLLGFLAAGLLHAFIPEKYITRLLGSASVWSVLKGALIGIPLPLCSCGVLPVASSLRASGAKKAPTLSFLITTPVTGVDSMLATWSLMGWIFMVARIAASFVIGMLAGISSLLLDREQEDPLAALFRKPAMVPGCSHCAAIAVGAAPADESKTAFDRVKQKLGTALTYGLSDLPRDMAGSVLLGLLLGGLLSAAIPPDFLGRHVGGGLGGILAAVAIGIPLYVCATGSIPIAAALMLKGLSPGAGLAFLIAGPATNMVALATVWKMMGRKSVAIYLSAVFVGATGLGWLFDRLVSGSARLVLPSPACHMADLGLFEQGCAVVLLALLLYHFARRIFRKAPNNDAARA